MTIKDLIKELGKYPPETAVITVHEDGGEYIDDTPCTRLVKTDGCTHIESEEEDPDDWEDYPWQLAVLIY